MKRNLRTTKFLFVDCQTTGMRPPVGQMLELAWTVTSLKDLDSCTVESALIALPEGTEVPKMVTELTGIQTADLAAAKNLETVFAELTKSLDSLDQPRFAIIHYAQFEKPFLVDMYSQFAQEMPFEIFCSHRLTKRLLPNLPSSNIRGAAGYFGAPIGGIKRAASHGTATLQIWKGLVKELEDRGIHDLASLQSWLRDTPKAKLVRYEYRLDKFKRLELPDSPGIYRMISKSGEVLYVGKATSLKSRVNSYFRGKKGRDQRKLEMLAQVWDLKVNQCETPLEAALMESDEIKRLNPRYNVVLKRGKRHLVFYNHDFSEFSQTQNETFRFGPLRDSNWIEHLRILFACMDEPIFAQIFFDPIPGENLRAGFELFCRLQNIRRDQIRSVRSLLAVGMVLAKNHVEEKLSEEAEEPEMETDEDAELSVEEIAGKFERLHRRAATEYRRSKVLTRLLNARIFFATKKGRRELNFTNGAISPKNLHAKAAFPWENLMIDDFDRMSILLSELAKYEYHVETHTHESHENTSAPNA